MSKEFTPEVEIVQSPVDEHGALVGEERLKSEDLYEYSMRLLDVYANRANSTYRGLLNAMTRDMGFQIKDAVEISLKILVQGATDDSSVVLTSTYLYDPRVYNGFLNGTTVTVYLDTFTDTTRNWAPDSLVGFTLTIGTDIYSVVSNDATSLKIKGLFPSYTSLPYSYTLELKLEENTYTGLVLKIGDVRAVINTNTSNQIFFNKTSFVKGDSYQIMAGFPAVKVTGDSVLLYRTYYSKDNNALDLDIPTRGEYPYISTLVDVINSSSKFFSAVLIDSSLTNEELMTLVMNSSRQLASGEFVPAMKSFKLENSNIVPGTVVFSETLTFLREVQKDEVPLVTGNYYIDYQNGYIIINGLPSSFGIVNYYFNKLPFTLESSPVILNSFANPDSQGVFFNESQLLLYDDYKDRTFYSTPKLKMKEYISEMENVKPLIWRE